MIDIVINNFRRLQYLDRQVRAIKERTDFPHRVIVVDNCSTDETRAFIENLIKEGLVWKATYTKKNLTSPQSFKRGVALVETEYCVLTLDDVMPPWSNPCWLTHLNHLIRVNEDFGAVTFKYTKKSSEAYLKENIKRIDVPLSNKLDAYKTGIEEFFQIAKKEDLTFMMENHRTGKMEQLAFGPDHIQVRMFAKRLAWFKNKKVGSTPLDFPLRVMIWRDENLGYPDNLPERDKFEKI